jgi:acetoin utilization protein AcuB|tara:strand:+ start:2139 stop:2570 length:432 start_codon:yes stop_codon:yes gene_type:complete
MQVDKLMSAEVVSINMDDTLAHVRVLFEHHRFHHLLVVNQGELVGIISDRDLLKAISPAVGTASETSKDLAYLKKPAHQIMTRNPVCLSPKSGLLDAIKAFNRYSISCLPIVNVNNKPIGILSWRDIFKFIEHNRLEKSHRKQ